MTHVIETGGRSLQTRKMRGETKQNGMRRHSRERCRGSLIGYVIIIIVILTTLAGIVAVGLLHHMSRERFRDHQVRAKQMAHGVLQTAIAKLKERQDFRGDIAYTNDSSVPEQEASLTFTADPDNPKPHSTNNTRSPVWVSGWDGPAGWSDGRVPPNSVHLVAVGRRLNAEYVAEALIFFPPFPFALASSGKLSASGRLEVLGAESFAEVDEVTLEDSNGGDIASNSPDSDAVVLSSEAKVTGDVRALGGAQLNGMQPEGELLLGEESDIPAVGVHRPSGTTPATDATIYVDDYDPDKFSDGLSLTMTPGSAQAAPLEVLGKRVKVVASGGPLQLSQGVTLDDGVLYVEGDVVISGGLKGMGAVVATGKITVNGPAAVTSDLTALVSGNGVTLDGQGIGRSKFQGLVATKGDFKANSATIAGAFVSSGDNPQARLESTLQLEDVRAVYTPEATEMNIVVHVELQEMLDTGFGRRDGANIGLLVPNGTFYTFTGDPSLSDAEQEAQLQRTYRELQGVQGQEHPLKDGQVVVRNEDGTYITDPAQLSRVERMSFNDKVDDWKEYTELLERSQVQEYKIFEIDLNRFSSSSSRLKIVTYR